MHRSHRGRTFPQNLGHPLDPYQLAVYHLFGERNFLCLFLLRADCIRVAAGVNKLDCNIVSSLLMHTEPSAFGASRQLE